MSELLDVISRHFGKLSLTWIVAGFIGWTAVAYFAWGQYHDGAPGIYVLTGWLAWAIFHLAPVWALSLIFWVRRRITPVGYRH